MFRSTIAGVYNIWRDINFNTITKCLINYKAVCAFAIETLKHCDTKYMKQKTKINTIVNDFAIAFVVMLYCNVLFLYMF